MRSSWRRSFFAACAVLFACWLISSVVYHSAASSALAAAIQILKFGGTGADLSATGGANYVLKQESTGAAVTVAYPEFSDGTAGAPGIRFSADTDTGIYRVGANEFCFVRNGAVFACVGAGDSTDVSTLAERGVWIPARSLKCFASGGCTETTVSGTDFESYVLSFADAEIQEFSVYHRPPVGWGAEDTYTATLEWAAVDAQASSPTPTVTWRARCVCVDVDMVVNGASFGSNTDVDEDIDGADGSTTYLRQTTSLTTTCGGTCTAGDAVAWEIKRRGTATADDYTGTAVLYGVRIAPGA